MSEVDENGEVYVVAQNGTGAGKHFKLEEMPSGITESTILRERLGKDVFQVIHEGLMLTCKNGEYVIKDKLR